MAYAINYGGNLVGTEAVIMYISPVSDQPTDTSSYWRVLTVTARGTDSTPIGTGTDPDTAPN